MRIGTRLTGSAFTIFKGVNNVDQPLSEQQIQSIDEDVKRIGICNAARVVLLADWLHDADDHSKFFYVKQSLAGCRVAWGNDKLPIHVLSLIYQHGICTQMRSIEDE